MRHPLHAAFVHFPLALLGTSLGFDLAGLVFDDAVFWKVAFWNISIGLSASVVTVTTGLADSRNVPADSEAWSTMLRHLLVMLGALCCYGLSLLIRHGAGAPAGRALAATLALESVGLALLAFGGWLGGELVYRHGIGRAR
jgi:uncharacterized membrane protein